MGDFWFFEKLRNPLVLFGLLGQCVFMLRFVVQWLASEKRGRSYVPVAFWYFSLGGGLMLLTYGIAVQDPVWVLGQSLGIGIYSRNLYLIQSRAWRRRRRAAEAAEMTKARRELDSPEAPAQT